MATTDNSPASRVRVLDRKMPATIGAEPLFQVVETVDRESALTFAQVVIAYMRERLNEAVCDGCAIEGNEAAVMEHLMAEAACAYRSIGAVV